VGDGRRAGRWIFLAATVIIALSVLAGAVNQRSGDRYGWMLLVLGILTVVLVVAGLVSGARAKAREPVPAHERRRVVRSVRAGDRLEPPEVAVAYRQLEDLLASRWLFLGYAAVPLILGAAGLVRGGAIGAAYLLLAIVGLLAIPFFAWQLRRDLGRYRAALARAAP
jgi:hypothetical protein